MGAESAQVAVLVLEDDPSIQTLLQRVLIADGFQVLPAASCAEAIDRYTASTPDIILCDKNLPDGSGLSFLETARNLGFDGEAIVVTAYSDTDSAIQAVQLGVFRYLRKPFDVDALRTDVRQAAEKLRLRRDLHARSTQLADTNAQLRRTLEQYHAAEMRRIQSEQMASLGYLAASIAHEINNPLSMLTMVLPYTISELHRLATSIEGGDTTTVPAAMRKLASLLDGTNEAIDLLMSLAADLHSLGRADMGTKTEVSLYGVVQSAVRIVRHKLAQKAQVHVDVPETLVVTGQRKRLVQVCINLLTNAARAIRDANPDANEVRIRGFETDASVVLQVSDTGIGIPEKDRERIFEPFVSLSGLGEDAGSGIGLAVVREVVEAHGGTISVDSEEGRGTTFTLLFPKNMARHSSPPPVVRPSVVESGSGALFPARRTLVFVGDSSDHLAVYNQAFSSLHDVYVTDTRGIWSWLEERADQVDVIIFDAADLDEFRAFRQQLATRYPALLGHVVCVHDATVAAEAVPGDVVTLSRPFRPAHLLEAIYRIPPRNAVMSRS